MNETQLNPNDLHLSHEQLCDHLMTSALSTVDTAAEPQAATQTAEQKARPATGRLFLVSTAAVSPTSSAVEDHLRTCALCTSELEGLRATLTDFREASTRFAIAELDKLTSGRPASQTAQQILLRAAHSSRTSSARPLAWAIAAVLFVGAAVGTLVPLKVHHPAHPLALPAAAGSQAAPAAESDEALLEEVDQTLSTNVPSAMKPLSDPLASQQSLAPEQTTGKYIDHE